MFYFVGGEEEYDVPMGRLLMGTAGKQEERTVLCL
jgi:hypothetical protein